MNEVEKVLNSFAKKVVADARKNAPDNTGRLKNSIKYDLEFFDKTGVFTLEFLMEEYGLFKDKGVSGTNTKYATPYSYTTASKNPGYYILPWVASKRFQFRDRKGRFTSYKSAAFLIGRAIKRRGMRPSLFFTRPFEKYFADLPDDVVEAYNLILDREFKAWLTRPNYTGPNPNVR